MSVVAQPIGDLLRYTGPDRLAEVVEAYVTAHLGGSAVEVLIADYRIAGLWPVLRSEHATAGALADRTAAARAFGSQEPVIEPLAGVGVRAHLPVTMRADRLGVLVVDLAAAPDETRRDGLRKVADELAVALLAADRSTDRYRQARRRGRLTMAAEMQWDMLPGRALSGPNFLVAGQLEPAYAVCGDHFDWSLDGRRLTLTTLNGDGAGLDATMLTVLAVAAMRNARRSGGNLIEQAELACDTVFGAHGGRRHVATLLLEIDVETGAVEAVDAGSPLALRVRGGQIGRVDFDRQLPLGMFGESHYESQKLQLAPGDRLVIVSDGVHGAAPGDREPFGARGLVAAVRGTRLQPATEAVGTVMRGLREYHDDHDLADDAVIVCLDWYGSSETRTEA